MRTQMCKSVRLGLEGANLRFLRWCPLALDLDFSFIIIAMKRNIPNTSSGRIWWSSCFFRGYFFVKYFMRIRIGWSSMLVTYFLFIDFAWNSQLPLP